MNGRLLTAIALASSALMGAAAAAASSKPAKSSPPPMEPDAVAPASSTVSTYRISPGDQLEIYVWGDDRLQRSMSVLPDGTIAFPLAGTVRAADRTPNQIEAELSKLLAPQYKGVAPQVTVSVRQTSGMQIAMVGKVRSPGNITPIRYITLVDALAQVGGPSDFADINNIIILRHKGEKLIVLRSRVSNILKGKPNSGDLAGDGNPPLEAGDTVIVP